MRHEPKKKRFCAGLQINPKHFSIVVSVVFIATLPLILKLPIFVFAFLQVLFCYYIMSQGLNLMAGYAGYLCFGQSVFFGIGAYTAALLTIYTGLPAYFVWPLATLPAALFALGLGAVVLRLRGIYFAISTVALNFIFQLSFSIAPYTGGAHGIMLPLPPFSPIMTEYIFYEIALFTALASTFVCYWVSRSRFGLGLMAIREDEEACERFGVNTTKLKILAFTLSGCVTGLAGGIYSAYNLFIDPTTVFNMSISMFTIACVILGGLGTVEGPLVGSIIFVCLSESLRYSLGTQIEGLHMVIFGCVSLAVIVFLREGIIGTLKKKYPNLIYLL